MITPKNIITISGYEMAGVCEKVTMTSLDPARIWQKFMPLLRQLSAIRADQNLYAIQDFQAPPGSTDFDPAAAFNFWAAIRIEPGTDAAAFPDAIRCLPLPEATYAVFTHKGPASAIQQTMNVIFTQWLPDSGYQMASHPQFQLMPPDYSGPMDANAEEEVWIPVKERVNS